MGATSQSANYPQWDKAWQQNLQEVDNQIIDYCSNCGPEGPDPQQLEGRLRSYFDKQPLDPQARSEYEQVQTEPGHFGKQLQSRVDTLRQQGKLEQGRTMQAGAASGSGNLSSGRTVPPGAGGASGKQSGYLSEDEGQPRQKPQPGGQSAAPSKASAPVSPADQPRDGKSRR
jgi:hypothetical protein